MEGSPVDAGERPAPSIAVDDRSLRERSSLEREALAERIEARAAPIAAVLGVVFVFVVIGESLATSGTWIATAFVVGGWALWAFFVGEFVLRMVVAPSTSRFWRRNWWQVGFLVLPFLRFLQVLRLARLARAGRIVSSAVRGTRSAGQTMRGRLGWLLSVHVIVILSASQLLFEFSSIERYGDALYRVALAAVSGEPTGLESGLARLLDVVLATYAIAFFATAAATVGAYLVERRLPMPSDAEGRSAASP
jgi:voltage-gated potassium channel